MCSQNIQPISQLITSSGQSCNPLELRRVTKSPVIATYRNGIVIGYDNVTEKGSQRWQRKARQKSAQAESESEAELAAAEVTSHHGYGHC
ncbi:MAG: hypothetical protein FRX49_13409 [Trebouxia sp. A1-2]|nr:MAG: hypothetical protein FRX49_13409 [Trebouxia sp. A1-2]